jgi:1-deoxy-D-xylulose-5-phosphate synthase
MEMLSEEGITVPVKRLGIPDVFLPHGSQGSLRKSIGIDKEGIKKSIKLWLKTV